jgi:cytochrome bd-type quinol oxidase subunit 2
MNLVTIAMLIVGLLLVVVYFVSLGMAEGVTFKGETDEIRQKSQSTYSTSMAIILALGSMMFTLALIMLYKPDAISAPKAMIMHSLMVGVALAVLAMAWVAMDQIDVEADSMDSEGQKLKTYLGVALLPASIAAVVLGTLVVYKPDALKIGKAKMMSSRYGFDFEF